MVALMLECDGSGRSMFERFTDKARHTVVLAQEEARALRHDHIGTEHLLLGLLRESDGAGASALTSLGIGLDAARDRVADAAEQAQGASAPREPVSGHIPFTPQAKRTLELALREALQLGHDYIGTGHILLGLVRDPACRGACILLELGADQAAIRERVIELRPASKPRIASSRTRLGTDSTRWVDSLVTRLAAVERFAGMTLDTSDLDDQLARLRREKESAIDAKDFQLAETLSDAENALLVARDRRASQWTERPSLTAQVAQLRADVERLRAVLREQGLDLDESD
jgi:Clp amino terminal domain, pathogenicity island component